MPIMRIGSVVEFMPTAMPWMMVVAAPVFAASTMVAHRRLDVAV